MNRFDTPSPLLPEIIALRYHGKARTLMTIGLYSNISWVAMLCTVLGGVARW